MNFKDLLKLTPEEQEKEFNSLFPDAPDREKRIAILKLGVKQYKNALVFQTSYDLIRSYDSEKKGKGSNLPNEMVDGLMMMMELMLY